MYVLILTTIALLVIWLLENARHQKNLKSIPIRIHVNGTRGKSSVTRLIAAGLRAGKLKTLAKTTGTLPRIIDENGLEIPVKRPHMVNIIEQLKIIDFMRQRNPDAIVMECMAVMPEYQYVCERHMLRSTVGVITNTRLDHIREMGPTLENVTLSLCNTLPPGKIAFVSERPMLPVIQEAAKKTNTTIVSTHHHEVTSEEMAGFDYLEHPDNVTLALEVCKHLNIDRQTALEGMHKAFPDVGAMKIFRFRKNGRRMYFINALAANDPDSTYEIWQRVEEMFHDRVQLIVMLNSRADRFERSVQLLEMLQKIPFDQIALTGQKQEQVISNAVRMNIPRQKLLPMNNKSPEEIYENLKGISAPAGLTIIYAIGNMGQGGLEIADYYRMRYKKFKIKQEELEVSET